MHKGDQQNHCSTYSLRKEIKLPNFACEKSNALSNVCEWLNVYPSQVNRRRKDSSRQAIIFKLLFKRISFYEKDAELNRVGKK